MHTLVIMFQQKWRFCLLIMAITLAMEFLATRSVSLSTFHAYAFQRRSSKIKKPTERLPDIPQLPLLTPSPINPFETFFIKALEVWQVS